VVGLFLIIQAPDASDARSTALIFRPVDRVVLDFESVDNMVCMVLDDIVLDWTAISAALGAVPRKRSP
jgi:hypothetical protein